MKRKALALTLIIVVLLTSIAAAAYYVSVNHSYQGENFLPEASLTPTASPSPTSKPTPVPDPEISVTYWDVPSSSITQSPTIIILSPHDNETFSTDNFTLKVNVGSQSWIIMGVYYEADWQESLHRIFTFNPSYGSLMSLKVSITANFTGIPDGRHSITVYSNTHDGSHNSASISFTTDASPPRISVLSIENKTFYTTDLPLNFTVDEPTAWIGYCLDGKANITISGNATLNGLSDGSHSVVIYANDTAGNVGVSEIVTFSIETSEPFPTTQVATASGASVAVIGLCLFVYFRKRSH